MVDRELVTMADVIQEWIYAAEFDGFHYCYNQVKFIHIKKLEECKNQLLGAPQRCRVLTRSGLLVLIFLLSHKLSLIN